VKERERKRNKEKAKERETVSEIDREQYPKHGSESVAEALLSSPQHPYLPSHAFLLKARNSDEPLPRILVRSRLLERRV